jgi:23S rRNA (uracil1939-C5)-methyltransferase
MSSGKTHAVTITRLGLRGDGIAQSPDGPLYVAGALPGETVRARVGVKRSDGFAATLEEIITPSPDRITAPCPHFGTCGGCATQSLSDAAYAAWKQEMVVSSVKRAGLDPRLVAPMVRTAANGRRRAEFAAFRPRAKGAKAFFGFHARASNMVVNLETCLIVRPAIAALIPELRAVLSDIVPPGARWDVLITEITNGLDILITANHGPGPDASMEFAMFAERADIARISWRDDGGVQPVAVRRAPVLDISGTNVEIPPGTFLQASAEAEGILSGLVCAAARGTRIADLYCGVGTFSLPLAKAGANVLAVDGDGPAVEAMARGAGLGGFGGQVSTQTRDLVRRPMMAADLKTFETVVFDPPRAGAAAQVAEIVKSPVPRVVAVSCNPASFAKDAAALVAGGYALEAVTPVDQFVWSGHVELVAAFSRP